MSKEGKRIFGFDEGSYLDDNDFIKYIHPEDKPIAENAKASIVKNGDSYNIDIRILKKGTSEVRYINSIARAEKDAYNNIIKINGIIHDITKRKKLEISLRQSK
mgnify:CR=1 FL=1